MRRSLTRATMLSVLLVIVCGWAAPAHAGIILDTPAGLGPGDRFRVVFVTTGKIDAISGNISVYDNFVQAQAGGATYFGRTVDWLAIGSTASVNAIDHIGQVDVPVYLVTGTRVTTSTTTAGLWSGRLEHAIDRDILGREQAQFVWTGTQFNGEKSKISGGIYDNSSALGGLMVQVGSSTAETSNWAMSTHTNATGNPLPRFQIYGISEVLQVVGPQPIAVPEPATVVLLAAGGVIALGLRWGRRPRRSWAGGVAASGEHAVMA